MKDMATPKWNGPFAHCRQVSPEEMKKLSVYEERFRTAIYSDYARAIWAEDVKVLQSIYNAVTGKRVCACETCSAGKLKILKEVGKLYYAQKKYEESIPPEKRAKKTIEDVKRERKEKRSRENPKRGRTRNIANNKGVHSKGVQQEKNPTRVETDL